MESELLKGVSQFGFPVVVALWLLFRTDTYVRDMTIAVRELTEVIRASKKGA